MEVFFARIVAVPLFRLQTGGCVVTGQKFPLHILKYTINKE